MSPRVSVLMPVYKTVEAHLRGAIESVLGQTFTDFELLILDDCPTDPREAVVKSYTDPRIKYLKNEHNLGISASRNKLIALAQGDYLAVTDHDDISLPERFAHEVAYLEAHPEVGVIGGQVLFCTPGKADCKSTFPLEDEDIKIALMGDCVVMHTTAMIRKSALDKTGIHYEAKFSPSEDYALWCRLIAHTAFHNLPEVLVRYNAHEGNTTHAQWEKMQHAAATIRAIAHAQHPNRFAEFDLTHERIARIKLFNVLPLLKVTTRFDETRVFLFDKIPFLTVKRRQKLR